MALFIDCVDFSFMFLCMHIDCMHKLWFLYMLNYPVIYSLSERERESGSSMQGTVYLSKIENSSCHQNLNHVQCQNILYNLVVWSVTQHLLHRCDESSVASFPRRTFPVLCRVRKIFRVLSEL